MEKKKVLFICIHNSARSQMAEAFLKKYGGEGFMVESAGLEAGKLNPLVVKVMAEIGIDISGNKTDSAFEFFKAGKLYDYVITVCDAASAERCPVFPGVTERFHWGFTDPSSFEGSEEEKLERTREVRDQIEAKVKEWLTALDR
jgi:arsenate reductase